MRRSGSTALVLVLLLAGCAGQDNKITIASAPNVFLSALYVAQDDGLFAKEGLTVEIVEVESGNDSMAALASGQAQYADVGFEDLAELSKAGDDSVVMAHDILNRVTLTLVMRKEVAERKNVTAASPLKDRLGALKGLKIGITSPGSPTDTYMRYYLGSVGLDPERDVEIVPLGGGSALLAALEKGQIDAYHLSPPTPYVAAEKGFGVVLIDGPKGEVPELDRFDYTAWATSRRWAEENATTAAAFSRVLAQATAKVKRQPDAVAEQIMDDLGSTDKATVLRTVQAMSSALSEKGCFDPAVVQRTLDVMLRLKILEEKADGAEGRLWTNEYNGC
ncbi:ABC-type nitrate/sulfonate/bicarbonate transport system, substrate-binding protein [Nonomuraea solani]|uniref:ABC-type nitrate/sulfonate/bicarbonate transport system, substrate-binding protein n=1 Tax=Nonomuraea solani TaxID=1144553 RepID=A0A1H5VFQ0_9ACTN|nr:ABC transporter substrate-binding protein [Nonomuraea solani]SEF86093.1 ABC-type nitrate/sulfonate/bicarbonate transport system, substrate-binding protein [Nonomuraea solani]